MHFDFLNRDSLNRDSLNRDSLNRDFTVYVILQCMPDLVNSVLTNHPDLTNSFLPQIFFAS